MDNLAKQFSINNLEQLRKKGNVFGVGNSLTQQVEDCLEDTTKRMQRWAELTKQMMTQDNVNIPVVTGNLRDSIAIDLSRAPQEVFVGVDLSKLKLGSSNGHDDTDYTGRANYANYMKTPRSSLKHEFIKSVWLEQAKRIAKECGFSSSAVRLNEYGEKMTVGLFV